MCGMGTAGASSDYRHDPRPPFGRAFVIRLGSTPTRPLRAGLNNGAVLRTADAPFPKRVRFPLRHTSNRSTQEGSPTIEESELHRDRNVRGPEDRAIRSPARKGRASSPDNSVKPGQRPGVVISRPSSAPDSDRRFHPLPDIPLLPPPRRPLRTSPMLSDATRSPSGNQGR